MDFTTKKILKNGRYILSTIFGFLSAITYFIVPYFNANVATNVVQDNFERTILSKSESSTSSASPSPSATTKRRRRRRSKLKFESSTLAPPSPLSPSSTPPPLSSPPPSPTRKTTTKTPSIFSSKSNPSTSTPPPPPSATTTKRETTIKTPSIFSSIFQSTSAPPPVLPSLTTTTPTMTTITTPSTFSSIFELTSAPPLALPSLTTTTPTMITTRTTTPSIFSSLFDTTPYSSPWMYSTSGDLIGSESGVFMASASELEEYEQQYCNKKFKNNIVKKVKQPKNSKNEYPPPIPSLRHKMPRDVPWSLSTHVVDGRLTLKEECMEYNEYLEATREDGRLVLKLIVVKSNVKCHDKYDIDDETVHEDEVIRDETISRKEKKKRIQEERRKDFEMVKEEIGTKKRRGHY